MKLHEITTNINQRDLEIATILFEECKPFLQQINYDLKNFPLFRGFQQSFQNDLTLAKVRKDRKPLGSPQAYHDNANEYFQQKFGVKVRSEALFTTGEIGQADEFGNVMCVLPKGDFTFYWSPIIPDFTFALDNKFEDDNEYYSQYKSDSPTASNAPLYRQWSNKWASEKKEYFMHLLDTFKYTDENLKAAIRSGHEIAIVCDQVYIFDREHLIAYHDIMNNFLMSGE